MSEQKFKTGDLVETTEILFHIDSFPPSSITPLGIGTRFEIIIPHNIQYSSKVINAKRLDTGEEEVVPIKSIRLVGEGTMPNQVFKSGDRVKLKFNLHFTDTGEIFPEGTNFEVQKVPLTDSCYYLADTSQVCIRVHELPTGGWKWWSVPAHGIELVEVETKSQQLCSCPILILMSQGCTCGGA